MSIDQCAARQYGLITHEQASRFGLSTRQINGRVDRGQWVRVVRGVYRIGGAPVTWQQTVLAACVAGPSPTLASHLTAAALHGVANPPMLPHVIVPVTASARLPIAKVHRADVASADRARLFGIPCTGIARTLIDCASVLGDGALESMVDDALCRKLTTVAALEPPGGSPGRKGAARLRRALDAWAGEITPGSPAEMRVQRQLSAWGFPRPARQHPVYDDDGRLIGRLDLAWPERLIGVEYDSDKWHNPRRWSHDESRHAAVARMGWNLLHADKADLRAGDRRFRNELERAWAAAGVCAQRPLTSVGAHTSRRPLQNVS
jgi:Transcriptional regulator, AbiEi antitoxin